MSDARAGSYAAGLALLLAAGCGPSALLVSELDAVQLRMQDAARAGAYYCAPRELALARAHLVFARADRERGETEHARTQLRRADLEARAAQRLSPAARCAPRTSAASEPPPLAVVPAHGPDPDRDGVTGASDRCPEDPEDLDGFADADGCPDDDNDLDGRIDALDQCPLQAEDIDGQADADGCPDLDADGDGVQDALDKCPAEPGNDVSQGCPRVRYRGLELAPGAVRLIDPILFEDGNATLRSTSTGVLDSVVELLREHPTVTLEVQGHTDSQGTDAANLALSQARAEAVVRYLVDHGVAAARLTPKGYGETRPMESNRTSQGRAINRRIELIRKDGGP